MFLERYRPYLGALLFIVLSGWLVQIVRAAEWREPQRQPPQENPPGFLWAVPPSGPPQSGGQFHIEGSGKIGGVLDVLGRTSVGGVLQSVSGIIAGGQAFGLGGDRGGQALITGTVQYDATHPEDALLLLQTTTGGESTDRIRIDREGNTTIAGRLQAGGRIGGKELCIGNECRAAWPVVEPVVERGEENEDVVVLQEQASGAEDSQKGHLAISGVARAGQIVVGSQTAPLGKDQALISGVVAGESDPSSYVFRFQSPVTTDFFALTAKGDLRVAGQVKVGSLCLGNDCKTSWPQPQQPPPGPTPISPPSVQLQTTTPGTPQTGNFNVSGAGLVNSLQVSGTASVGSLNALGDVGLGLASGRPLAEINAATPDFYVNGAGNVQVRVDQNNNDPNARFSVNNGANAPVFSVDEVGAVQVTRSIQAPMVCIGTDCKTSWPQPQQPPPGPGPGTSPSVQLQSAMPGTPQAGSFNVNGTGAVGVLLAGSVGITGTQTKALDVGGGIEAGTGNVQIVDATGKIPGISGTTFADLSGANLTNLNASNIATGTIAEARLPTTLSGTLTAAELAAAGKVTGTQLCIGNDCKQAWSQVVGTGIVRLQPTRPGVAQTGHLNIDGDARVGAVVSQNYISSLGPIGWGPVGGPTGQLQWSGRQVHIGSYSNDDLAIIAGNNNPRIVITYATGNTKVNGQLSSDQLDVVGNARVGALCLGNDCKTSWPQPQQPPPGPGPGTSPSVQLQSAMPGTPQAGSFNVNGTGAVGVLLAGSVGITGTQTKALDVGGGIEAGTGNVQIVDATGKIPGISGTTFADLSGANLTNLNASNIATGTIAEARLPTTLPRASVPTTFTGAPTGSGVLQGTLMVNPSSANIGETLLGIAVGGQERLRVDARGNLSLRGNLTSAGGSVTADTFCINTGSGGPDCKVWSNFVQNQFTWRPTTPQTGSLHLTGTGTFGKLDVDSLDSVKSRTGIDVRLDHDRATAPDSAQFRIFDGSSTTPIFTVNRWAGAQLNGGLGISGGHLTTTNSVLAESTGQMVSGYELRTVSGGISSPISSGYLDFWGNATGAGTLKVRAGGLVLGGHGSTVEDYSINANGNADFGGTRLTIGGRPVLASHRVSVLKDCRAAAGESQTCDGACATGEVIMSGGCTTSTGAIREDYPVDTKTWRCTRTTTTGPFTVYGVCARLAQ